MTYILLAFGILFGVGLSAFFSLSETALLSLNRYRIRFLIQEKGSRAAILEHVLEEPEKILSPILLGNTLANVITAMLTAFLVSSLVVNHLTFLSNELAQLMASILISILILIIGEITPKSVAARYPERMALKVIYPLRVIVWLLHPLIRLALWVSNQLIRRLVRPGTGAYPPGLSVDELKSIITHHSEQPLDDSALEMIHNVFEFPTIPAGEIMTPRNLVLMLPADAGMEAILELFLKYEFSSIPIFDGSPDNILGVVQARDFYAEIVRIGLRPERFALSGLVQPATFIPESAPISEVLKLFQESYSHFAVVVDEFGQFEGIITLQDILEEIVGEIICRSDEGPKAINQISNDLYLLDGLLSIRDFNRTFDTPLPTSESYSTLAGFLMSHSGKILEEEEIMFWAGYRFVVEKMEGRQIKRVLLQTGLADPALPEEGPAGQVNR
ncbi:MAG: HlyC/CorC family transporter [Acidobacteria bacterium]|nr:HlyC/CorC family transporter [Acidobacteriota bacterium]